MRGLLNWDEHSVSTNIFYLVVCILLVCFAGCMSGLTLGLMSLERVDLEVLKRSGTPLEAKYADKIIPLIDNAHFLLVTLLVCNAAAMEALPIFLDRLVNEVAAIIISVSAVLIFGEIIPQAACVRYGLVIGATMAWPVRILMILTSPISWPLGKLLDFVLGGDHASLFRRTQLKALVEVHAHDEGLGGKLSPDEIRIIKGALDMTSKTAYSAITPLEKVFMLSTEDRLDDLTIKNIINAKPFSRLPIYKGHNRRDIIGLVLVKDLLQVVRENHEVLVKDLQIRTLPRLSASTPMYDMLKLFRTGRSHMAVLTQPEDPDETVGRDPDFISNGNSKANGHHQQQHRPDGPVAIEMDQMDNEETSMLHPGEGDDRKQHPVVKWMRTIKQRMKPSKSVASMGSVSSDTAESDEVEMPEVPQIAQPGEAIGIITIEDVIEELMQQEIVDEMDKFVDNMQSITVNREEMEQQLPSHLTAVFLKATALGLKRHSKGFGGRPPSAGPSGLANGATLSRPTSPTAHQANNSLGIIGHTHRHYVNKSYFV